MTERLLLEAAERGMNKAVKAALAKGVSVNCKDYVCIELCCIALNGDNAECWRF